MNTVAPHLSDVVIAGGGPVGLALALELGRREVSCVVIEPRIEISHRAPRAKTASIRTMEHARRWGIAESLRQAAPLPADWPAQAVFCTSLAGNELHRFDNVFGMRRVPEAAEAAMQIPQPYVEDVIRAELAALPSVTVLLGSRVTGLSQTDEAVHVRVSRSSPDAQVVLSADTSHDETFSAQYAVGCDGGLSTIRGLVGITQERTRFDQRFLTMVLRSPSFMDQLERSFGRAVHYWVIGPDGAGVIGPLDGHELFTATLPSIAEDVTDEDVLARLHRLTDSTVDFSIVSRDYWHAKGALADAFRSGRVFLAGDAAHSNPPFGGHGFNTGVGDAVNLGWKLAAALQGWGGPRLLDTYDQERRGVARRTLDDAAANMEALSSAQPAPRDPTHGEEATGARVSREIERAKTPEFFSKGLVLGYDYSSSALSTANPGMRPPAPDPVHYTPSLCAGVRLPHAFLRENDAIYDRLGERFSVVIVGELPDPVTLLRTAAELGLGEVPVVRVPIGIAPGYESPALVLVRPDQHIAWSGTTEPYDITAVILAASGGVEPALNGAASEGGTQ